MEFTKYHGKHKRRNACVGQMKVGQKSKIIRTRIDDDLFYKVKQTGIPISTLIREVLTQYIHQIEIEDI